MQTIGHSGRISCVAFSRDSLYVVTGSEDMSLKVWEAATGKLTQVGVLVAGLAVSRSGSALVLINEVNLRRAQVVMGWVTVSGFDSRRQHFISVCNQQPRSTQPSTVRGTV